MTIEEKIKQNKELIFNTILNLNLDCGELATLNSEEWRYFCTNQNEDSSYYQRPWRNYFLKNYSAGKGVNKELINNDTISELFSDNKILNVFYFEVWGSVLEHKDPKGFIYGYPEKDYKTLLMPIAVPTEDKNIFKTFYGKNYVELVEGEFMEWDVSGVPHHWEFDYPKINKLFKLLHIDYIN